MLRKKVQFRVTQAYRSNILEKMICEVRDQFAPESGQQVHRNGTISTLGFTRRRSHIPVFAKLELDHLCENLIA